MLLTRGARVLVLPALLLLAAPALADVDKLRDASMDRIDASTVVPDPARKVGEVRLVERGKGVVVQTLLVTRLLSRVTSEIRSKENGNWPRDYEPATKYLAGLEAAKDALESAKNDGGDRRRRLLIEFAADDEDAIVVFGSFDSDPDLPRITPTKRRILATLELPRAYVLRNIRLILADSFHVAEDKVDELGPLGPASSSAPGAEAFRRPAADAASSAGTPQPGATQAPAASPGGRGGAPQPSGAAPPPVKGSH